MKTHSLLLISKTALVGGMLGLLSACGGGSSGGGDDDDTPRDNENAPPTAMIANLVSPQPLSAQLALDANASTDPDGDALQYQWSILTGPAGHNASITDAVAPLATLVADVPGAYTIQLVVNDGTVNSAPASVSIVLTNTVPLAEAGADRAVDLQPGTPLNVTLNGSGSSDADGHRLSYVWQILDTPEGSTVILNGATEVQPTLTGLDLPGTYTVGLTVNDGYADSARDQVQITTNNVAPVADAGNDIGGKQVGDSVTLNGTQSSDFDGDSLSYQWAFTDNVPTGPLPALDNATSSMPSFTIEQKGNYELELTVSDGELSDRDTVWVNVGNTAPVANAGSDQVANLGDTISLSADASTDVDGDRLQFSWSILTAPAGSSADISDPNALNTGFTPDISGTYVVQLRVSDGETDSIDSVQIDVDSILNYAPVANAGSPQSFDNPGVQVVLDGSASSDPDNDALLYSWSFKSKPDASMAELNGADTVSPSFIADTAGVYEVQLSVSDGELFSINTPTVIVTVAENTPPQADAGTDQSELILGATVALNGSGSNDPDGDTLTYQWSVTSAPAESQYQFSNSTVASPDFTLNQAGDYLLQLTVSDGMMDDVDTVQLSVSDGDLDGDGLLSSFELDQGLLPNAIDSDGDSINDGLENEDGDSLNNQWEQTFGYRIDLADSDDDGIADGDEDFDNDGYSNQVEIDAGTDPTNPDSRPVSMADQFHFEIKSSPVVAGGQLIYSITAGNLSEVDTLSNLVVSMTLPAGVSFNRFGNASLDSSGQSGCLANGFCDDGDTVTWSLGDLEAGASISFEVDADIGATVLPGTTLTTPLSISSDSFSTPLQLVRSVDVVAEQPAHFTLNGSDEPIAPGERFEYRVYIGNTSDDVVDNMELNLTLPDGLGAEFAGQGGVISGNTVTWSMADLLPTQSLERTLSVRLSALTEEAASLITRATLSHDAGPLQTLHDTITVSEPLPLEVGLQTRQTVVAAGDNLVYVINLSNVSTVSTVENPVLMLRVPNGVSFNRFDDASFDSNGQRGCLANGFCDAGDEVFWSPGNLAAGDSLSFQINATVDELVPPGSLLQTPIFVSADGLGDLIQQQNTARVVAEEEVYISLHSSKDPVAPGETFDYILHYGNASDDALLNGTLSMTVPMSLIIDSVSNDGAISGDTITWNVPALLPTQSLQRRIRVTMAENAVEGATLNTYAALTFDGGQELDQSLSGSVTVAAPLKLETDFHLAQNVVRAGGELKYHITLSNTSLGSTVENPTILLRVPQGVSFNRFSNASLDSSGQRGCLANGFCDAGDEVYWTPDNLGAGESLSIEIDATVDDAAVPGTIIATPVFIDANGLGDTLILQETAAVVAAQPAHFQLQSSADPVAAGSRFTYQLNIGNPSDDALENLAAVLTLPAGVSVVNSNGGSVSGATVTWTQSALLPTQSLQRTVQVEVDAAAAEGDILTAQAALTLDGGLEQDQGLEHSVTVSEPLKLEVDYHLDRTVVAPGDEFVYRVTLSNTSLGSTVSNAALMLRVPDGISFNRLNDAQPNSSGHRGCLANGFCDAGDEVYWAPGNLAAGDSVTIQIRGQVSSDLQPGSLVETPIYITADNQGDTIQLERNLFVVAAAPAQLTLNSNADPVAPGGSFQYQVNLGNPTNEALSNLSLDLVLPAGLSVISISDGGVQNANRIQWTQASLGAAGSLQRTVTVMAANDSAQGSTLTSRVELRHDGGLELDQSVSSAVTVSEPLKLDVDYAISSATVNPGDNLVYNFTLRNTSVASLVENPVLMLELPDGVSFNRLGDADPDSTGHTGCLANGFCDTGDEVFWSLDTIPAGETITIQVSASVSGTMAPGSLIELPIVVTADGLGDNLTQLRTVRVTQP